MSRQLSLNNSDKGPQMNILIEIKYMIANYMAHAMELDKVYELFFLTLLTELQIRYHSQGPKDWEKFDNSIAYTLVWFVDCSLEFLYLVGMVIYICFDSDWNLTNTHMYKDFRLMIEHGDINMLKKSKLHTIYWKKRKIIYF